MLNVKQYTRKCASLALAGRKANDTAHLLAIEAMEHAKEHGDVRPMDVLINAMTEGRLRAEGMRFWVMEFSPIRWNGDGKIGLAKPESKLFKPFNIDNAVANPFWTLEGAKERTVKELSPAALKAIIDRYLKTVNEADKDGFVYDKDGNLKAQIKGNVITLKEYAAKMAAINVPQDAPVLAPDVLIRAGNVIGKAEQVAA